MTYEDDEIRRPWRLGEDSRWEFKEIVFAGNRLTRPRRDDLADEIAAAANAQGSVLLCGVADDGDVQGMSRAQMHEWEHLLAEICSEFHTSCPPGPYIAQGTWGRAADSGSRGAGGTRAIRQSRQQLGPRQQRLAQKRGTVAQTGLGTLNKALWKLRLSLEDAADPALALEKMGLLATDESGTTRATVAGILLCSHAPNSGLPNACIAATRATGGTDWSSRSVTCTLRPQGAGRDRTCLSTVRKPCLKHWTTLLSNGTTPSAEADSGWPCSRVGWKSARPGVCPTTSS